MVSKQNIGNSGEYWVSYILSAHDCVVTITLGRNIDFDLLVVNPKGNIVKIQVKTMISSKIKRFTLNKKHETLYADDLFYVFVRLNDAQKEPDYWVVPSRDLANVVKYEHAKWLKLPGKGGHQRRENDMRSFSLVQKENFPDKWDERIKEFRSNLNYILDY